MKIEIRNVKYARFMSDETECFQATVVIDGKVAGTVENEGHGGDNNYHPFALGDKLAEYAQTLPKLETKYGPLDMDADLVIDGLFQKWQAEKTLKRLMKTHIVFTRNGKLYQSRKMTPQAVQTCVSGAIEHLKGTMKAETILNVIPMQDAVNLYLDTTGVPA